MKYTEINMPPKVRYMNQAVNIFEPIIKKGGKCIINKVLTGCGGTTLFLDYLIPIVLVSPRSGMLLCKNVQYQNSLLFRDPNDKKSDLQLLKQNLRIYLDNSCTPFSSYIPKILVTIDSCKYVLEELEYRGVIDKFLFVVDEFHDLISDSMFKAQTDYEFLFNIDSKAKNIIYLSATPIRELYLNVLDEFKNIPYYKLKWDPSVIVEPTLREIHMKKGESAATICLSIINQYRHDGYFAKKIINDGNVAYSYEAVFFINEVKTIRNIILKANLQPDDVKILVSQNNSYVSDLQKRGFRINEQEDNPNARDLRNKPFTFCSKASFEGRDFYSLCASTYIFLDGSKSWETLDTPIDIPQILGRQRLDANPFKYNATIYYRTKPNRVTKAQFMSELNKSLNPDKTLVETFMHEKNGDKKMAYVDLARKLNPSKSFLAVVDKGKGVELTLNGLAITARYNLWEMQDYYYSNPHSLICQLQNVTKQQYGTKPNELRKFEATFYGAKNFQDRMKVYAEFISKYPQFKNDVYANPYIDFKYHEAYEGLGAANLALLQYDESRIYFEVRTKPQIVQQCKAVFISGATYSSNDVKNMLQDIYNRLDFGETAKATQLKAFMLCKVVHPRNNQGKQYVAYQIT